MMSFAPNQLGYSEAQAVRFFEQVAARARLVPGVKSATLTRYMPMDGGPPPMTFVPEGFQFPAGQESATHGSSIVDEQGIRDDRGSNSQGTGVPGDRSG